MTLSACCADLPATALCWRRAFPGRPDQAAAARRFVAMLLPDCPLLDDVLLVADELVVNTLRHTRSGRPGGEFRVEVRRSADTIRVAVTDQGGPAEPVSGAAGRFDECGRGLRAVSALAESWGWHGNGDSRTVTAVFTVPATSIRPADGETPGETMACAKIK